MSDWREEMGLERIRRASGHGLRGWLLARTRNRVLWRIYWAFQPIRCRLGFHDWYSVAAGECSACLCGASEPYPVIIVHRWRDREKRQLASIAGEAEYRAEVWYEAWQDALRERVAA